MHYWVKTGRFISCFILVLSIQSCIKTKQLESARDSAIIYLKDQPFAFDYVYFYEHLRKEDNQLPPISDSTEINQYLAKISMSEIYHEKDIYLQMKQYYRLVDDKYQISDSLYNSAVNLNKITLPALYCDQREIDTNNYFQFLKFKCSKDEYSVTHVLLALIWLEESNCFNENELKSLKKMVTEKTKAILGNHNGVWEDITLESVAFLQKTGVNISKKHLKEILALQQIDGGWKQTPEHETSNAHTTILAILLLNEYINRK